MEAAQRGMSGMQASGSTSPAATCLHSSPHRASCFASHHPSYMTGVRCSAGPHRLSHVTRRWQGLAHVGPSDHWQCARRQMPGVPVGRRPAAVSSQAASAAHEQLHSSLQQAAANLALDDLGEGLEAPVQLLYLLTLLGFLVVGAYLVVRQVLVRRELEEAAKVLGERIRTNEASSEDCFELGVILLRKKLYTQATKNLEKAARMWEGEPEELAQVHNALGFAYFNMDRTELALKNYGKAVELQPGYVTAWNNLGNAQEKAKDWVKALKAYEEALSYSPENKVARSRAESLRTKVGRINMTS